MMRRSASSVPTGLVLAALVAIGIAALVAWAVLGRDSQNRPLPVIELPVAQ